MGRGISRRGFLAGSAGIGLGMALGTGAAGQAVAGEAEGRVLHFIDCTQEYGPDQYFGNGAVSVVESAAGRYREAEGTPLSRFGYRFAIEHIGKPHVAIIRYPDDKQRFMCIMDGTSYDLTTGVLTGWEQPLSGEMIALRQVFWPRWTDCTIVFMTWGEGEPAAACSIEIRELPDLPALEVPGDPKDGSRRSIGIQYEDPCGCAAAEGAMNHTEWTERIVQYAKHTGQNLLIYPMAWYHGPQFPSEREPSDGFGVVVARDRKMYNRWVTKPADWYAGLLDRFGREGLEFQGALTLLRLGSLMQKMNIDLAAIQGGADTFNNMMWNNQVQSSTNDWTPLYNAVNFNVIAKQLEGQAAVEPFAALPQLAYGERSVPGCHTAPMFNPLHPVVQEAILGFVSEIGQRYANYPAFKGISFNMFASAMPWYGSIHAGYDDYSVNLFQQETGIAVPVDAKAPDRFSQRYTHLTEKCRPAWVDWRCRKIRALFGTIREALAAARPDLRVTVTLWDETTVTNTLGEVGPALQLGARLNSLEFYREAGIDIRLYGNEPGLEIDRGMGNMRDRGGHPPAASGGVNRPISASTMYRDFDYLDQETLDAFRAHEWPGAFIFNCWVEAWGRHVWFSPEPGDPHVAELTDMDGKPAEGVLRMNSEYPEDNFWFDSQLRITPAFPSGPHFLEPYAHALAEFDACRITRGGLFLDKAHTEQVQAFVRAYRALPDRKFETVGTATDPVAVRTLVSEGRRYGYAVNRDYYPVDVAIAFSGDPGPVVDLATGESSNPGQEWRFTLEPYGLRAFTVAPEGTIAGFTAAAPEATVAGIINEANRALETIAAARAGGRLIPGMDTMEARMRAALAEGRIAWLRRALTSYVVRTCRAGGA